MYEFISKLLNFVKVYWRQLLVLLLILIGVLWLNTHSVIEITANDPNKDYYVKILNQGNEKKTVYTGKLTGKKFYVTKGSYEIDVETDDTSFVSINKTKGFFLKTKVNAELKEEKARSFVGNEPGTCMNYFDSTLISYACGTALSKAYTHIPANDTLPTFVLQNTGKGVDGYIEGGVTTNEGNLVLVDSFYSPKEEVRRGHYIEIMKNNSFEPMEEVWLENLNNDIKYRMVNHKEGFLIYSSNFEELYYYKSVKADPEKISLEEPDMKNATASTLHSGKNGFVIMYSNSVGDSTDAGSGAKSPKNEVVVYKDNEVRHFVFDGIHFGAKLCPQETLCLLSDHKLEVYNIDSKKPKLRFELVDVSSVEAINDKEILVVREKGITNINIETQTGYKEFGFGEFSYNALYPLNNGNYILNLTNNKQKGVVLLIDRGSPSDKIDKKISDLQRLPEVASVSAYGKYIYVSPNAGEMIPVQGGGFDYDPIKVKAASDKIKQYIDELQIAKEYKVYNTLE